MLLIVNFLARQYLLNIWDEGDWVYSSGAPNTTAGPSLIACLVSDCDILFCGSCILKSDYDIPFCPPSEPLSDNPEQGSAHTDALGTPQNSYFQTFQPFTWVFVHLKRETMTYSQKVAKLSITSFNAHPYLDIPMMIWNHNAMFQIILWPACRWYPWNSAFINLNILFLCQVIAMQYTQ